MATTKLNNAKKDNVPENEMDSLTSAVGQKKPGYTGPYVDVFLPALEGGDEEGIKVDQYEHVTIANEDREDIYYVLRGERVSVPVPVYMVLKERYGKTI